MAAIAVGEGGINCQQALFFLSGKAYNEPTATAFDKGMQGEDTLALRPVLALFDAALVERR